MKNVKYMLLKVVAKSAYKEAVKEANSACIFGGYQNNIPREIQKLRKFK